MDTKFAYFDSLAVNWTATLQANPEYGLYRAGRALAFAGSGRKEAAIQDAHAALRMPATSEATLIRWYVAEAYLMIGERDAAVDQLRIAMSSRNLLSPAVLRFDPIWDPLRDHSGFQELLAGGN